MSEGIYKFDLEDARRFAREMGIRTRMRGDELHFLKCPYCRNTTDDKNTFSINARTGQFKCLRATCGKKGNMITLARDFDFELSQEVTEYYNSKRSYRDLRRYPVPVTRPAAVAYLEERGISQAIAKKYHITTRKDDDKVLVFPFYDEKNQMQFIKYRNTDFQKGRDKNKEWCEANCKPILFGMDQCDASQNKTLVMTEGQIDSLSVAEAFDGKVNAVSVPTGAMGFTWVPYCWDFLCQFKELIVFGDYEKEHITLLEDMRTRFRGTIKHVRFEDYKDCKDANDLLRKYGKQAVINAVNRAEHLKNPRIKKLSEVARRDKDDMAAFDTGIVQLNKRIGGFEFGKLITITGERGLGKSTLASQFIAQAVKAHIPSFCYSGELPEWFFQDWFDRQCAGNRYITSQVTELEYTEYPVDKSAAEKIHAWYDENMYIYDNSIVETEENETILETLENAVQQYGCRVFLIDNLMTVVSDDMSSDLYRQQSAFVRQLMLMTRKYSIIIFLVVHPRKMQGRTDFVNDDVSGSANITNLSDIILRYAEPKEDDTRGSERILQITKNRNSGGVDYKGIPLWFEVSSKRISERRDYFDWTMGWESDMEENDGFLELPEGDTEAPW